MSNPFKYFKDKKEIWADWEKPVMHKHIEAWNNRPNFPVSPELDALLAHEQVIDRTEFELGFKCNRWCAECKAFDWSVCENKYIAIPLPKEPEEIAKPRPFIKYEGNQPEQQDIPMEKQKVQDRSCPCLYLDEPCHPRCTCVNGFSSSGCMFCCTYGSYEQRKHAAERIASKLRTYPQPSKEDGQQEGRHSISLENVDGHATFTGKPSKEIIEAVNIMAEKAYHTLKKSGWKEKFQQFLTNEIFLNKGVSLLIADHVEKYLQPKEGEQQDIPMDKDGLGDYWEKRCKAAEALLPSIPCPPLDDMEEFRRLKKIADPDVWIDMYNHYQELLMSLDKEKFGTTRPFNQ